MNKINKQPDTNPFQLLNKEKEVQLNAIAKAIDSMNFCKKNHLSPIKLAIDLLFELERAGFTISKERNIRHLFINLTN